MKIKNHISKAVIIFMIASLLSSCATIPGMSLDFKSPQNSEERKILVQSVAIGAAGGAAAGFLLSRIENLKKYTPWLITGGVGLGSAIAYTIANSQIQNLRDIQLENDRLTKLLNSARQYNNEVASYNNNLRSQIYSLKSKTKPERIRIAQQKAAEARQRQAQVKKMIQERTTLSNTLVSDQKAQYQKTLADLQSRDRELSQTIAQLDSLGMGRVG